MAPPAMDVAFGATSCGPPKNRCRHPHPGEQDGGRESAVGRDSDPWRIGPSGRRGLGANRLAAPAATRRPPSQTWRTFLTTHLATRASIDFFTVPTFTGRVLFVLVVLMHHRRRIVHVNVTEHPTAVWTAPQMVEAFPDDTTPRWILRSRRDLR